MMNKITQHNTPSLWGRVGERLLLVVAVSAMLTGCSDMESISGLFSDDDAIHVGGVETGEMTVVSRAAKQDADKVDWLVQPLTNGLDITYGLASVAHRESQEDVAILKLTDNTTTPATYSFNYRKDETKHTKDDEKAQWHNNGFHYFQGVHVPDRIRFTSAVSEVDQKAPNLMYDQHDDNATGDDNNLGNYTLLSHYLGMPANYRLTATVERIKLPFRHRLARVVAFVLIDPELNTKLKGYQKDASGKDDPNTTSLRFCNVKVLQGVKDVIDGTSQHHTLTPTWHTARKIVPHFDGERGSYSYKEQSVLDDDFKLYTKTTESSTIDLYPTTSGWQAAHDATNHNGYTEINYRQVPVYDIIARPTYTSYENVMYDEEGYNPDNNDAQRTIASAKNSIDFEIELENGLRYEKTFEFDLNANYQTVVYLRISREKVDYDDAGAELWIEEKGTDAWYGVDNDNGNTLSKAGSSWQRAYRTTTLEEYLGTTSGVTDGDLYNNGENVGQYLNSKTKWTELLLQACEGGKHHGDYFVLDHDITINAQDIPAGFIFTGHLDAQDHTITLTGTCADTYEVTTNYALYSSETLYNKNGSSYVAFEMPPTLYISEEVAQAKPYSRASTIPAGEGMMKPVHPTLADVMGNDVVYYILEGETYKEWNPRSWTFYTHRISSGSLFCGLNGTYTTRQEKAEAEGKNIYNNSEVVWEANVHKETNKSTVWVPTLGYRAEVLNAVISGGTLFPSYAIFTGADATVTGNVQNCFNKDSGDNKTAVTNTPNIPQYK